MKSTLLLLAVAVGSFIRAVSLPLIIAFVVGVSAVGPVAGGLFASM